VNEKLRRFLTFGYLSVVLAAFAYGSSGCASAPPVAKQVPCPERTSARIESILEMRQCTGEMCETMMVACFVSQPLGNYLKL